MLEARRAAPARTAVSARRAPRLAARSASPRRAAGSAWLGCLGLRLRPAWPARPRVAPARRGSARVPSRRVAPPARLEPAHPCGPASSRRRAGPAVSTERTARVRENGTCRDLARGCIRSPPKAPRETSWKESEVAYSPQKAPQQDEPHRLPQAPPAGRVEAGDTRRVRGRAAAPDPRDRVHGRAGASVDCDNAGDGAPREPSQVTWIDVQGLGDEPLLRRIGEIFGIHPLALADVVNVPQRPEGRGVRGHDLVIIARMVRLDADGECDARAGSIVVGRRLRALVPGAGTATSSSRCARASATDAAHPLARRRLPRLRAARRASSTATTRCSRRSASGLERLEDRVLDRRPDAHELADPRRVKAS